MPSVLNQLLPMIKSYSERMQDDYTCEDFFILLVYMYSVVGEIRNGEELNKAEEEVKKALVKAICDEPELSPLLQKITGKILLVWWGFGWCWTWELGGVCKSNLTCLWCRVCESAWRFPVDFFHLWCSYMPNTDRRCLNSAESDESSTSYSFC